MIFLTREDTPPMLRWKHGFCERSQKRPQGCLITRTAVSYNSRSYMGVGSQYQLVDLLAV